MPLALSFDAPFEAAIAYARARGVLLSPAFYDTLQRNARVDAFTISSIASLSDIQEVLDSLNEALADGDTFEEWQDRADGTLELLTEAHQEVIFRNAVQTAYSVGHTMRQRENAATQPFLMWDAINDSRTRETHAAMDGFIAPMDDPIWSRWDPPAGHNCRCARIALTRDQALARGYPTPDPHVEPDPGFAYEKASGYAQRLQGLLAERAADMPQPILDALDRIRPHG